MNGVRAGILSLKFALQNAYNYAMIVSVSKTILQSLNPHLLLQFSFSFLYKGNLIASESITMALFYLVVDSNILFCKLGKSKV